MRAQGISLWLVPDGPESLAIAALIGELSARFGTPQFSPHVTLLGGIASGAEAAVAAARDLAAGLSDLSIHVGWVFSPLWVHCQCDCHLLEPNWDV